jgi:protein ImuB
VVVGFTRYGTYALAKTVTGASRSHVLPHPADEQRALGRVPIARLGFEPGLRDALRTLGIDTLGGFAALPANGVLRRFGVAALRLHRLVRNDLWTPIAADPAPEAFSRCIELERPETDLLRLMAGIEKVVHEMLAALAPRALLATQIEVQLRFENRTTRCETLRPAAPTRAARVLLQLVHLRLETLALGGGVESIRLDVGVQRETSQQLDLFATQPRRSRQAGDRALARLRAEFGDDVVVHAALRAGHLPEARFHWVRCEKLASPAPQHVELPPLVRRLLPRPVALAPRPRHEPDGWLIAGPAAGPVEEIVGPHVIAGGWWMRSVERAYHFVRTQGGAWLWVFEDRRRRGWFLNGSVE